MNTGQFSCAREALRVGYSIMSLNFVISSRSLIASVSILVFATLFCVSAYADTCAHEFFRPYYKTRSSLCSSGELVSDFYTGKRILCEEAEVDHIVSLREAYLGGVCGDELKSLAKDPENLRLTHWTINRRKGALKVEDFFANEKLSGEIQARNLAASIRTKYGVLSKEDAFSAHVANYYVRDRKMHKSVPITSVKSLKGLTKRQIGKRVFYFSGKRLVGYTIGIGIAAEAIILIPDGFSALGRATSTPEERRRADYILELLK